MAVEVERAVAGADEAVAAVPEADKPGPVKRAIEARGRGRGLFNSVLGKADLEETSAEAFGALAAAVATAEQQPALAKAAAGRARNAVTALGAATTDFEIDLALQAARDGERDAKRAATAAVTAEAKALKAEAELATRSAGAESALYPAVAGTGVTKLVAFAGITIAVIIALAFLVWSSRNNEKNEVNAREREDARVLSSVSIVQQWFVMAVVIGAGVQAFWLVAGGRGPQDAPTELAFVLHLVTGGAALVVGGLLGFLFGIPRTPDATTLTPELEADTAWRGRVATNTSLERISVWLTTLLVGATLVEFGNLTGRVWDIAGTLSGAAEGVSTPGRIFTASLLVYYFGVGFLGFYLLTRTYLTYALASVTGQGRFAPSDTLDDLNVRLGELLRKDSSDLGALRAALARAAALDGASQRPDHLVLRLRASAVLHKRAAELKDADQASIRQEAVRDLGRLARAAQAWGKNDNDITNMLKTHAAELKTFAGDPMFAKYGVN